VTVDGPGQAGALGQLPRVGQAGADGQLPGTVEITVLGVQLERGPTGEHEACDGHDDPGKVVVTTDVDGVQLVSGPTGLAEHDVIVVAGAQLGQFSPVVSVTGGNVRVLGAQVSPPPTGDVEGQVGVSVMVTSLGELGQEPGMLIVLVPQLVTGEHVPTPPTGDEQVSMVEKLVTGVHSL
jgi:hypothetical protein